MQDLTTNATGGYTLAQLTERLTSGGAAVGCRFDVLDPAGNLITNLGSIQATGATVEYDTSRPIVGSLGLSLLPNEAINLPFYYRVRPWFRLGMLDGGVAEWPVGVYLWNVPTRYNVGRPDEWWEITLGDQGHILFLSGPGANGHIAPKGAVITDVVAQVISSLGLSTAGIVPSPATLTEDLSWGVASSAAAQYLAAVDYQHRYATYMAAEKAYQREAAAMYSQGLAGHTPTTAMRKQVSNLKAHVPKKPIKPVYHPPYTGTPGTAWFDILSTLLGRLGYNAPWFDLTGLFRANPQPDMTTAATAKTYVDGQNSVVVTPTTATADLTAVANRVIAQSNSVNGYYDLATADLNVVSPGHPLSQQVIGFYIDAVVPDQVSTTQAGLLNTATAELHRRASTLRTYSVDALAWPVHEAYDFINLRLTADVEIGTGVNCLETDWTFDLRAGSMTHALQRVTP